VLIVMAMLRLNTYFMNKLKGSIKNFYYNPMLRTPNSIRYNKHRHRKNNDLVAAMYAMYKKGPDGNPMSLAAIGKIYKKSRQAVYDVFHTRGYQLRSKEMKGLQIIDGIKFSFMKGGYLRGTTPRGRMSMQKYVWEKCRGRVPSGYVIHHKDGNRENNNIENLHLVAHSDMARTFNPGGRNQYKNKLA
jgi:hypothetical protein